MPYMKTILSLTVAVALSACSAASQQSAETETVSEKHTDHHRATVKPGASVTMNSALPKSMTSGSFQTVQLRFDEVGLPQRQFAFAGRYGDFVSTHWIVAVFRVF